jgi:hypothetical protein
MNHLIQSVNPLTASMKFKIRALSILISIGLFYSCQDSRQVYIRSLLSNVCFWDVLGKDFNTKSVKYTYRLLPDRICYQYQYQYIGNEKQKSVTPTDKENGEVNIGWDLKSDSVLTIGKEVYKVRKVDDSTVWLETSSKNSLVLHKNCSAFIID